MVQPIRDVEYVLHALATCVYKLVMFLAITGMYGSHFWQLLGSFEDANFGTLYTTNQNLPNFLV